MHKPVIFCVVGTRPEAIKVAPVVRELRRFDHLVTTRLVSTGQHKEILLQALATFGLAPDDDLGIMKQGQSLAGVTCAALEGLDRLMERDQPAVVLGQGDTTTAFCAALGAFYRRIPFGHIEAGLRTTTIDNPFPEEFNRRAAGLVASLHFPPTVWARDNLLAEGKDPGRIIVTGNTGIDAVLSAAQTEGEPWFPEIDGRIILLTTHRRENWGEPQRQIVRAARAVLDRFVDTTLIVPMHPNPNVRETLQNGLADHPRVRLIEPPEYARFVKLMQRSTLILSDSGGVQEEAPAFGLPVLVLRDTTERPEGVTAGTARLVGTDAAKIEAAATELLGNPEAYKAMANAVSPYGDGKASQRIRFSLLRDLGIETEEALAWA
ncbi:MAG: non-hydrolyzing UDP-N-acetylglucosamine 2-epimerase [Fimbriimonas sp.]